MIEGDVSQAPASRAKARQPPTRLQRLTFQGRLYWQLARILAVRAGSLSRRPRIFVSLMGSVGDLVYLFPSLEALGRRYAVDLATGGYPYRAVARNNPHLARVHSPFAYKRRLPEQRRLVERVLSPFYERVVLLDPPVLDWWKEGKHFVERYAAALGCRVPPKGVFYLSAGNRRAAADYLHGRGLDRFVYVTQMVRRRYPLRSWPLTHYHALLRLIHERFAVPIVVDTVGSSETAVPDFCVDAGRLDVLTAAAVIERATLFVGSDSGLTHVAGALGTPTVAIHLGYPPETCGALGDRVTLVRQGRPFDEPSATSPEEVLDAVERRLHQDG